MLAINDFLTEEADDWTPNEYFPDGEKITLHPQDPYTYSPNHFYDISPENPRYNLVRNTLSPEDNSIELQDKYKLPALMSPTKMSERGSMLDAMKQDAWKNERMLQADNLDAQRNANLMAKQQQFAANREENLRNFQNRNDEEDRAFQNATIQKTSPGFGPGVASGGNLHQVENTQRILNQQPNSSTGMASGGTLHQAEDAQNKSFWGGLSQNQKIGVGALGAAGLGAGAYGLKRVFGKKK